MSENLDAINFAKINYGKVLDAVQSDKPMPESDKKENITIFETDNEKKLAENPVTKKDDSKQPKESQKPKETHYLRKFLSGINANIAEICDNILEHPIKSAATIGAVSLGIAALPLVGIPSSVGVAVLAIIYGATSLVQTGINLAKFFKHKNENNIDLSEKDMYHLGKNTTDLALSLPFVPKGLKDITKFSKYGKIGLNKNLIANIKNAEGIKSKFDVFSNATKSLNTDMNIKGTIRKNLSPEMRQEIEPLLKLDNRTFAKKIYEKLLEDVPAMDNCGQKAKLLIRRIRNCSNGNYDNCAKNITINSKYIDAMTKSDIVSVLVHELQHYKQYIAMDKANLYKRVTSSMKTYIKHCEPYSKMSRAEVKKHYGEIYQKYISPFGNVFLPEKPTKYVRKLVKADREYVDIETDFKKYRDNFLEVDARAAEIPTLPVKTLKDALLAAKEPPNATGFIAGFLEDLKYGIQYSTLGSFVAEIACAKDKAEDIFDIEDAPDANLGKILLHYIENHN